MEEYKKGAPETTEGITTKMIKYGNKLKENMTEIKNIKEAISCSEGAKNKDLNLVERIIENLRTVQLDASTKVSGEKAQRAIDTFDIMEEMIKGVNMYGKNLGKLKKN